MPSGPLWKVIPMQLKYREEQTTQAAARLLHLNGGRMNYMKLIKLLYLADRQSLVRWGRPITFDYYVSMDYGPVLSHTYREIREPSDPNNPSYWNQHIKRPQQFVVELITPLPPTGQLSEAEDRLLDEMFEKYRTTDPWDLCELTHELPEWNDPKGSSRPIDFRDILRHAGLSNEHIREIEEALFAEALAEEALA